MTLPPSVLYLVLALILAGVSGALLVIATLIACPPDLQDPPA